MEATRSQRRKSVADVHFHPWNYAQQGTNPKGLIRAMQSQSLKYTVLAPIPTSLLLRCGNCTHNHVDDQDDDNFELRAEHLNSYNPATGLPASTKAHIEHIVPNYYISDPRVRDAFHATDVEYELLIKKDGPLYYDTNVDSHTAAVYNRLSQAEKDKFDPMITGLALGDIRSGEKLIMKLHDNPGVFTGVGEITVFKEWVQHKVQKELQADLTNQQLGLIKLMKTCGTIGMPVVLHCDVNDYKPDSTGVNTVPTQTADGSAAQVHFANVKNFLKHPDCRNTTIIWAHAGGLGKYSRIYPGHLDNLKSILTDPDCSHVSFDLSWDVVGEQLLFDDSQLPFTEKSEVNPEKLKELTNMLEAHPNRFLFGSDSLSPFSDDVWNGTERRYKALFSNLSDSCFNAIRIENYERLIVNARKRVRLWEQYCLPYSAADISRRPDSANRPPELCIAFSVAIYQAIKQGEQNIEAALSNRPGAIVQYPISASDLEAIASEVVTSGHHPWMDTPNFGNIFGTAKVLWERHGLPYTSITLSPEAKKQLPPAVQLALQKACRDAIIYQMKGVERHMKLSTPIVNFPIPDSFLRDVANIKRCGEEFWNSNADFKIYLEQSKRYTARILGKHSKL
jgi:hypothetical protein